MCSVEFLQNARRAAPAPTGMCCSDEQMRAEVYVIRERGATAAGAVAPRRREKVGPPATGGRRPFGPGGARAEA